MEILFFFHFMYLLSLLFVGTFSFRITFTRSYTLFNMCNLTNHIQIEYPKKYIYGDFILLSFYVLAQPPFCRNFLFPNHAQPNLVLK